MHISLMQSFEISRSNTNLRQRLIPEEGNWFGWMVQLEIQVRFGEVSTDSGFTTMGARVGFAEDSRRLTLGLAWGGLRVIFVFDHDGTVQE